MIAAVVLCLLVIAQCARASENLPRLQVQDDRVVNADGKTVALRGVNLGNWLLIEPGGLGGTMGSFSDQAKLLHILRDRFGETERRRLIDLYRDSYITARDFDNVKTFGFNVVRVGFDIELFEDDDRPWQLRADAFKYLDFAVREAKARGIYVLFDLHGAPGRQVNGKQSGDASRADFWTIPDDQERALRVWEQIARHFKGDSTVFGYEMLNEPFSATAEQLLDFAKRWYARVRPIDAQAVLMFPGLYTNVKFYGKPADHGWANCMFDMHFYPGVAFTGPAATQPSTPESASRDLLKTWPKLVTELKSVQTPLFVGELSIVYKSGGGGEMLRRYTDFAADHGWAVCVWTLKELTRAGGVTSKMWMLTTNAGPIRPVDVHTSPEADIEAAIRNLATMPLVIDDDTLHWQTTAQSPLK